MKKLAASLALEKWNRDLRPTQAVCELFDFLEEIQFWIKDRAGRYRWVNVAFLLNYAIDERKKVLGQTDFELSPSYIAAQFRADDDLVLTGQVVTNRVELVGRFDHTARWCATFKRPLRDSRGTIIGTAGITRPVESNDADWESMPLGKVVKHISEHFRDSLENHQLAGLACLSERTFERRFRQHYGLSPQQYVKRLRVRVACHALVYSDLPIAMIALEHGFADQSYFTHEFRDQVGHTPRQYRESFRGKSP